VRKTFILVLALALAGCNAPSSTQDADAVRAQVTQAAPESATSTDNTAHESASAAVKAVQFDGDAPGDTAQTLPAAIARALGTDELVLTCADGTRDGVSQFAADWVAVDRLDLNGDGRADWIVHGRNPCLRQADAAYWWLYEDTADTPRLLLRAEPARALEVLATSTRGYRDLRMQIAGGRSALVADNKYDGQGYSPAPP
jgi:hypothetical protein